MGFLDFILVNSVFVVGPGNYMVQYAAEPDTLAYTPESCNVRWKA